MDSKKAFTREGGKKENQRISIWDLRKHPGGHRGGRYESHTVALSYKEKSSVGRGKVALKGKSAKTAVGALSEGLGGGFLRKTAERDGGEWGDARKKPHGTIRSRPASERRQPFHLSKMLREGRDSALHEGYNASRQEGSNGQSGETGSVVKRRNENLKPRVC